MLKALLLSLLVFIQSPIMNRGGGYNNIIGAPNFESGASTFQTVTGTSNVQSVSETGGEAIAILVTAQNSSSSITVSDSNGTTTNQTNGAWDASSRAAYIWTECNAASGNHTITVSASTSTTTFVAIQSYTGAATSCLDVASTFANPTNSGSLINCNAITTTQALDTVVVNAGASSTTANTSSGNGLTQRFTAGGTTKYSSFDGIVTAAGSYTPGAVIASTSTPGYCTAVTFKHI
jgi:hypothetical protein